MEVLERTQTRPTRRERFLGILGGLKERGLSVTGCAALLSAGAKRNGVAMGEIAKASGVSTAAMTQLVDRLERKGLVGRRIGSDRREVLVYVTADGIDTERQILELLDGGGAR